MVRSDGRAFLARDNRSTSKPPRMRDSKARRIRARGEWQLRLRSYFANRVRESFARFSCALESSCKPLWNRLLEPRASDASLFAAFIVLELLVQSFNDLWNSCVSQEARE